MQESLYVHITYLYVVYSREWSCCLLIIAHIRIYFGSKSLFFLIWNKYTQLVNSEENLSCMFFHSSKKVRNMYTGIVTRSRKVELCIFHITWIYAILNHSSHQAMHLFPFTDRQKRKFHFLESPVCLVPD